MFPSASAMKQSIELAPSWSHFAQESWASVVRMSDICKKLSRWNSFCGACLKVAVLKLVSNRVPGWREGEENKEDDFWKVDVR